MHILLMVLAGLSFASEPTRGEKMTQFLDALDGHWEGHGTRDDLDMNSGRMEREKFDLDIEVDRGFGGEQYDTRATLELDHGQTEYGTNSFSVRGDLLFAQAY